MRSNRYFYVIVGMYISHVITAQNELAIGQWQSHLPYQQGVQVSQSPTKIIYATPWSIVSIDKNDQSIKTLSTVEGLSDTGIERIAYDGFNDQLVVAYDNGNLDFVKGAEIINIPTIARNTSFTGSKRINHINPARSDLLILSMDFGLVELDAETYLFKNTIISPTKINATSLIGSTLYAATEEGLYFITLNPSINSADFNQWLELSDVAGLTIIDIINWNGQLFFATINAVYTLDNQNEVTLVYQAEESVQITYIDVAQDLLATGVQRRGQFSGEVVYLDIQGVQGRSSANCVGIPQGLAMAPSGQVWYADLGGGLRYSEGPFSACQELRVLSPYAHTASDIVVRDAVVAVASGGVSDNFQYLFGRDGFYLRSDRQWFNFNENTNSAIRELDILSPYRVSFHPTRSQLYIGSYWAGLLAYDWSIQEYILYNKENSTLRGAIGDEARERVTGMQFDKDNNLWVSTYGAIRALHVKTEDGQWFDFTTSGATTVTKLMIDPLGFKWMLQAGSTPGVLVYDNGENIQNQSDDRQRIINRSNSILEADQMLSMAVDRQGAVWIGTNNGPYIFDCGEQVFSEECTGVQRIVVQDGIPARLLADQEIRAIAIDGADRKWFGTKTGVYVQSPSGEEQIVHFTNTNSPLHDNEISALAYDQVSGIMWIGTNKGLMSYNTGATKGESVHKKDVVYAYPNPVPPNYTGDIGIIGLVEDAIVKITDIDGLLVTELQALGGQAVWDGRDAKGRRISSGVYLVFSSGGNIFDGPDSFVTKIMVLR